jgi:hypothetical protein
MNLKSETKYYGHWNLTVFSNGTARLWKPRKRGESLRRVQKDGAWTWVFGAKAQAVHPRIVHDIEIMYTRIGGVA